MAGRNDAPVRKPNEVSVRIPRHFVLLAPSPVGQTASAASSLELKRAITSLFRTAFK
jgi:hypothetical protein